MSAPHGLPVRELLAAGVPVALGSDNIRDFWNGYGNGDMLEGALLATQRLGLASNEELDMVWQMLTIQGARVLGLEGDYGVSPGRKADLIVLDALSPQWAIITQARKEYVIKEGEVVAENGKVAHG